ncbi:ATP-binding cassette domain-containing protein [Mesomycoplasma hyopneumoniae]|uniref:ATP-binding cassette domain-containing protein n=1 Tax=Mesomycoplasma hyopneumoniae TaxID=2099 RepID=UPI00136CDD75|nr:ATP-binding cassette domain-containing protein [Mesomycoplasma hyopneumoniae]MXR10457.1 ATP-binding cassette domain-containing protein [Mesomycoplasma hyopneumoniae]MXR13149.1 ATP-binding cassette domain-containing protein [Mesomycoplasma hyopneumoniae]
MIKIINLSKKITSKLIFENLNIEIPSNKITFVVGESGVGKSTLINLIAGFTAKDEGEIRFFKNGREEKTPLIDVVFQDSNLIEQLSVKNNILVGNSLIQKETNLNLLEESANFLNIQNSQLDQKVKKLTTIDRQKVAILRAFSRNSDFILLDEPTRNLNQENASSFFENLKKISKNKTILVTSRNLKLAKEYADQVIRIKNNLIEIENLEKSEENNSEKSTFDSTIEQKPANFPTKFKTGFLLVFADFKSKIITTILLIIAFFISIFAIVTYLSFNSKTEGANFKTIFQHQLDSISIQKKDGNLFELDEIKKIKEKDNNIVKILPGYLGYMYLAYNNNVSSFFDPIDFVDESDFFSKRFKPGTKDFQGRFIKNENEIIISSKLAKKLKIENPIGKKVNFFDDINNRKNEQELLIVGINNAVNQWNQMLSFVHFNSPVSTFIKNKQRDNNENDQIFSLLKSKSRENSQDAQINKIYYEDQPEISKFRLLEGKFPKNSNEIAISSNMRNALNFGKKSSVIDSLISSFSKNNGQKFKFKIVGIFDSNSRENQGNFDKNSKIQGKLSLKTEVIFHHTIIEKSKIFKPRFLKVFFDYKNLDKNIKNFWNSFPGYKKLESPSMIKDNFEGPIIVWRWLFISIAGILLIFFLFGMIFYSINLASSKKKIIGILKNLKAKTWQIFLFHWMTGIFISLLVLIFGLILMVPLIPEIYHLISGQNVVLPPYSIISFYVFIIWLAMFLIFSILFMLVLLLHYKKSVPAVLRSSGI